MPMLGTEETPVGVSPCKTQQSKIPRKLYAVCNSFSTAIIALPTTSWGAHLRPNLYIYNIYI